MAWMSKDKLHESRRGLELKFFHNVFPVGFNGIYTEVQVVCNLLVSMLPADELEDLFFPPGKVKLLQESVVGFIIFHRQVRAEGETGLSRVDQVNGMKQVPGIAILEQIAPGSRLHGFCDQVRIVVPAYNNNFHFGVAVPDQAAGFQPVHHRHIDVYQHYVGEAYREQVQEFLAIGGYVGDAEGRVCAQEIADSGGKKPVIIRQHNVNRHVRSLQVHE